jgi:tRNA modification GTPase
MIVRVSGRLAPGLADELVVCDSDGGLSASSGTCASRAELSFSNLRCPAWVYRFVAPRSYTGEDLVEFHLPGNPVLVRLLLRELESRGLRPAEPGEFTARSYFNGRLDLTAAEGVAATIAAGSEQELVAARRLLAGELARRRAPAVELLANTRALLEVGIDFSDEDVTFLSAADLRQRVGDLLTQLSELLSESARFEQLAHEPGFVLVGQPNAGKSSLLNALAGYERAVASPVAGTTRDALAAVVTLPRGWARVIDIAGIEESGGEAATRWRSSDTIE